MTPSRDLPRTDYGTFPDDSGKFRMELAGRASLLSAEWGKELGWVTDEQHLIVPEPIAEAVMSIESKGNPDIDDSPDNAIGLMQVTPTGQEASWYTEITGETVTEDKLRNRDFNFDVALLGLGKRMEQVCAISPITCSWYYAAAAYFGKIPNSDGTFPPGSDYFGTTGKMYYEYTREYVYESFGEKIGKFLDDGFWAQHGEGGFTLPDWEDVKGAVTSVAQDTAREIIGYLYGSIDQYLPRIALIVGGVLIIAAGVTMIVKDYTPVGQALKQASK